MVDSHVSLVGTYVALAIIVGGLGLIQTGMAQSMGGGALHEDGVNLIIQALTFLVNAVGEKGIHFEFIGLEKGRMFSSLVSFMITIYMATYSLVHSFCRMRVRNDILGESSSHDPGVTIYLRRSQQVRWFHNKDDVAALLVFTMAGLAVDAISIFLLKKHDTSNEKDSQRYAQVEDSLDPTSAESKHRGVGVVVRSRAVDPTGASELNVSVNESPLGSNGNERETQAQDPDKVSCLGVIDFNLFSAQTQVAVDVFLSCGMLFECILILSKPEALSLFVDEVVALGISVAMCTGVNVALFVWCRRYNYRYIDRKV